MLSVETICDCAIELVEAGYKVHPLRPGTKIPLLDNWPASDMQERELQQVFQTRHNLGVITGARSNLVVVDFDEKQPAREFYAKNRNLLKTIVQTGKGVHFWFRHPGDEIGNGKHRYGDIRGDGGQVVAPVSQVAGWTYRYVDDHQLVPPEKLPPFDPSIVETLTKTRPVTRKQIRKLESYLSRIQSVQGQNGSAGLMRFCYICRDAGLSEAETMVRLLDWNETDKVQPSWSRQELARAVTRAFQKGGAR